MTHDGLQHLPVQHNGDIVAMLSLDDLLYEMVAYLERVFKEYAVDQQIVFLSGTYSC
jgi:signal-transduction protein with cAMP-binding, CBS, and nucleotidyltransferase domain